MKYARDITELLAFGAIGLGIGWQDWELACIVCGSIVLSLSLFARFRGKTG